MKITAQQLLIMNNSQRGELLQVGPEEELPRAEASAGPSTTLGVKAAKSHLEGAAGAIMNTKFSQRANSLKADNFVKNKFETWLAGKSLPRLWLQGKSSSAISAIVYRVAHERHRPIVAFACCHIGSAGEELSYEERLFKMVFSILFQLLHQFEEQNEIVVVTDVDGSFEDLTVSMDSMPLALNFMRNLLCLVPQCIVVIDGWHFLGNGGDILVHNYLKDFLTLFDKPLGLDTDLDGGRLLLTTLGSSSILSNLGKTYVDSLNVTQHVDKGFLLFSATLMGVEW